ncbi:phosphonate C-P lyase system protein PhnH [Cupriavidus basilensis]
MPPGLSPALSALLLALADSDTPVWLPPQTPEGVRAFLRFHCGCPLVAEAGQAACVAVPAEAMPCRICAARPGRSGLSDRSATLLLEVQSLCDGHAVSCAARASSARRRWPCKACRPVSGPSGKPTMRFPLGVDVLLDQCQPPVRAAAHHPKPEA